MGSTQSTFRIIVGLTVLVLVLGEGASAVRCVPGEVHVWRIELDCAGTSLSALAAVLSQDERKRGHDCDPPSSASAGRSLVGLYAASWRLMPGRSPDLWHCRQGRMGSRS